MDESGVTVPQINERDVVLTARIETTERPFELPTLLGRAFPLPIAVFADDKGLGVISYKERRSNMKFLLYLLGNLPSFVRRT